MTMNKNFNVFLKKNLPFFLIFFTALVGSQPAFSAPPPGHPTPEKALKLLKIKDVGQDFPNMGQVVETLDSNQYTYIRVKMDNSERWLAVSRQTLSPGTKIRFPEGLKMSNFYSKVWKRTFPEVFFMRGIQVVDVSKTPISPNMDTP